MKLRSELEQLKVQIGPGLSPQLREDAEKRLKELDLMIGLLD